MRLEIVPVRLRDARRFIGEHHRHNLPPRGWLFGAAVVDENGRTRAVGVAGRPVGRGLDDGRTVEITRVCSDGAPNACSMLYGALWRAARALGYRRAITYTLATEPGSSLRAAGFVVDEHLEAREGWDNGRHRVAVDLFGNARTPTEAKVRWIVEVGA